PLDPARLADRPARPAVADQGNGPDWSCDRPRISAHAAGGDLADQGRCTGRRAAPAHGCRTDPLPRRATESELRVQACAGAGRRLWLAAPQPPTTHPRANRLGAE